MFQADTQDYENVFNNQPDNKLWYATQQVRGGPCKTIMSPLCEKGRAQTQTLLLLRC